MNRQPGFHDFEVDGVTYGWSEEDLCLYRVDPETKDWCWVEIRCTYSTLEAARLAAMDLERP